jgi:hypothetical protein
MKSHDFNTFGKLTEKTTTFVLWEKSLKKEGTYPKRDINSNRLQRITVMHLAYIIHWNNVFIKLLAATLSILVHSSATSIHSCGFRCHSCGFRCHSCGFQCHSCGFQDSSGMAPFLQECVGHDKVLGKGFMIDTSLNKNNAVTPQAAVAVHSSNNNNEQQCLGSERVVRATKRSQTPPPTDNVTPSEATHIHMPQNSTNTVHANNTSTTAHQP